MLLVIDVGNTNIVFAVYEERTRRGVWRSATDPKRTADEYAVWLVQVMALEGLKPAQISAVLLASVVPAATFNLKRLASEHLKVAPKVVGEPGLEPGMRILLDRPEELGADRLVNAIAAVDAYTVPLIIVDFGTATTFDVVDAEGSYRGGAIAPGVNLSLDALHGAAAKLPKVDIARPARAIGRGTVEAMQSGIWFGYVGLIEGLVRRIAGELGQPPQVIATGGLAPVFADATDVIDHVDPDLTLTGLVLLYERNRESGA